MNKRLSRKAAKLLIGFLKKFKIDLEEFESEFQRHLFESEKINSCWLSETPPIGDLNFYYGHLPDRYTGNLGNYEKGHPFLKYDDLKKWVHGNHKNNSGDFSRFFFLNQCFEILLKEGIAGNVAELGVYKGNSAFLLSRYASMVESKCYLMDTFEGFDSRDIRGTDSKVNVSHFQDTSLDGVKKLVGNEKNVVYLKGYFPESISDINIQGQFAFVHIDCDLEKPFTAALEYFYPRLCRGGFLVMHDYSSLCWPGATEAVDAFFADKPEFIIPVPDKSGTCVVRKV